MNPSCVHSEKQRGKIKQGLKECKEKYMKPSLQSYILTLLSKAINFIRQKIRKDRVELNKHYRTTWFNCNLWNALCNKDRIHILKFTRNIHQDRTHTLGYKTRLNKSEKKNHINYALQRHVKVKVAQSCLTLCNPIDYRVHGILQARILEWVAFPFTRGSSQPRDWTQVFHIAGGFFTSWATKEAPQRHLSRYK